LLFHERKAHKRRPQRDGLHPDWTRLAKCSWSTQQIEGKLQIYFKNVTFMQQLGRKPIRCRLPLHWRATKNGS
jgi:hypothetical protein